MRHSRRTSLRLFLFAVLLAVAAPAVIAGECPLSGTSYAPDYASPIGLPRCIGTINKWTPCEVCMVSDAVFSEQDAYTQSYYPPPGKTELQPRATFTQGPITVHVDGFFDGLTTDAANPNKAIFRIRFTPTTDSGMIPFMIDSSDPGLRLTNGLITAGPASGKGFLRREPATNELPQGSPPVNPRTFVWDNGNHPFVWGQTLYQIVEHARAGPDARWQTAITGSASYKMNKVRLLVSPWGKDPRLPVADSKAFQKSGDNLNRDILDIGHWQALDKVTSFLKTNGMIEDLILFHDGDDTSKPYGTDIQNKRYTRYTVARYAAFTNVIWTLANEYQNITPATDDNWNDLGCLIRGGCRNFPGADPWFTNGAYWRPLSIHNNINAANAHYPCFDFFLSNWPAHVSLQTRRNDATTEMEAGSAILKNSINRSTCPGSSSAAPQLPVINDEYYYIGQKKDNLGLDRVRHREFSWAIAANGGFGSTGDLQGPTDLDCKHGPTNNPDYRCSPTLYTVWVEDQTEKDAYGDIKSLINFFTANLNGIWPQMVATTRLSMYDTGTRVYGMEGPGPNPTQYVVYTVRDGGPTKARFNMRVPAGHYSYTFYDPTNLSPQKTQDKIVKNGTRPTLFPSVKAPAWIDLVARIVPYVGDSEPDDTAWVWDELPAGAITGGDSEGWTWIDDEPAAIADSLAHTSNLVAGMHQHYFTGASETLSVSTGDFLYAWVYLDPLNPPSEVMLQWNDGNWEHRAYWGANQLGVWGTDGTNSRRYMGPLPATDQWVRLQVPASAVGLEGHTLNGMAFTLFGGKATWDDAGKSASQCSASSITQQPQSQTIIPGASATLSVAVSGNGPFQYQFYQSPVGTYNNPTGISTATINTGPLYTTKQYWAEVIDNCRGVFLRSDAATITVQCTAAPVITQQPTTRVTTPGQSTTLSVSATQAVSYQWYVGNTPSTGTPITNATNSTLTVAPQSTTNYCVRVTNGCGLADSALATVCVLPSITANPTPRTINPGQSTTLTVSAINAATYQWYVGSWPSTATPTGGNSSSLSVSPLSTTSYWVRTGNSCGTADSSTVTVTVVPPPPPQITRIQSVSVLANSQSSLVGRWTQPTQPGTFLVAVLSGLKDPAQLDWTAPAGWQLAVVEEWPNVKLAIYYLANNAGARTSETFTVQQGYHDMTLYMFEYSGMMAVNPLDRTASTGGLTNNGYVQTGYTANTVQPKELVITALTTYTQTEFSVSPTDGYTEIYDQYMLYHLTTAMYEKITTSIGSYGHSATVYVPAEWAGVVATFRGANTN